ncbi:MAG: PQQ-like beta-propeller repeat protein [Planctomycetales bacterium]|nr:PQQ-like beta-propeller repeat protein [bacterium]UNM09933.1 MAG: PQQ-like beta-propeller repeat protein [Planctomycetales bacterium]
MNGERPDPQEINERLDPALAFSDALEDNYVEEEIQPSEQLTFHSLRAWQTVLLVAIMAMMVVAVVYFTMQRPEPATPEITAPPPLPQQSPIREIVIARPPDKPGLAAEKAAIAAARAELFLWRYHIGDDASGVYLGPGDVCYCQSIKGNTLYAIREGSLLWSFGLGRWRPEQTLAMENGDVAIRNEMAMFYLDGSTGRQVWKQPAQDLPRHLATEVPTSGPFADGRGNLLFTMDACREQENPEWPGSMQKVMQCALRCADNEGRTIWQQAIDGRPGDGLVVGPDGTSYFASNHSKHGDPNRIAAINRDGKLLWQFEASTELTAQIDMLRLDAAGVLLAFSGNSNSFTGTVHALDTRSGRLLWSETGERLRLGTHRAGGAVTQAANGVLFVYGYRSGSQSDFLELFALDSRTGRINWSLNLNSEPQYDFDVCPDGRIYLITHGLLSCISPAGQVQWELQTSTSNYFQVEPAADGRIFVHNDSRIRVLDSTGQELIRLPTGNKPFAIDENGIFYTVEDGDLVAFQP